VFFKAFALTGRQANAHKPRALPWAKSFCPFRACCLRELGPSGRAGSVSLTLNTKNSLQGCCPLTSLTPHDIAKKAVGYNF